MLKNEVAVISVAVVPALSALDFGLRDAACSHSNWLTTRQLVLT
jgi:hypothetical protein